MNQNINPNYPEVAVLLAAFNGAQWLEEQVMSILNQSNVVITLFISVDLSSDDTESLVASLSAQYPQIKHLDFGSHFGGAAKNFYHLFSAVDFQPFQFVALADQDDIWLPDKLKRAISCLSILSAQGYSSNATAFWEGGKKKEVIKSQKQTSWDFLFEAAGPGCTYVFTQNLTLQIQLMLQVNWQLVNTVYMHDWLIYAFARSKKFRWFIDEKSFILYRQHSRNHIGANIGMNAFIKRFSRVLSGWALSQSLLIATILDLESTNFVMSWRMGSRTGYLRLSKYSLQCRRSLVGKVYFLLACLVMSALGSTIDNSMLERN